MFKNLLLAAMTISLASCNTAPPAPTFCPIAINANGQVKDWFKSKEPLPQYMRDYLKNIGDQQADIGKYCK